MLKLVQELMILKIFWQSLETQLLTLEVMQREEVYLKQIKLDWAQELMNLLIKKLVLVSQWEVKSIRNWKVKFQDQEATSQTLIMWKALSRVQGWVKLKNHLLWLVNHLKTYQDLASTLKIKNLDKMQERLISLESLLILWEMILQVQVIMMQEMQLLNAFHLLSHLVLAQKLVS